MNAPGGNNTGAGHICTTCPHGKIEVIVWKHAVCWDTPDEGEDSADVRFEGVSVRVNEIEKSRTDLGDGRVKIEYDWLVEDKTDANGKVTFENLTPAWYTVTARKIPSRSPAPPDQPPELFYEDVTDQLWGVTIRDSKVILTHDVEVKKEKTSYCDLVLRAKQARYNENGTWDAGRECMRRHGKPAPQAGPQVTLDPILWAHEPTWLVFRDIVWMATALAVVLGALVGLIGGAMSALSIAAIGAAFFGYLGGLIFGEGFGTPAIVTAAALLAVLLAANLLAAAFGFAEPDAYGMGTLAGIWAAFSVGYLPGRRDVWRKDADPKLGMPQLYIWASGLVGGAAAGLVAGMLLLAAGEEPSMSSVIFAIIFGMLLGALSGWAGYAFANEGKTNEGFGATDFKLPYLGERYCLQGLRGFWSHYATEEGCYDFSMPLKTEVLCGKEGHIVSHLETLESFPHRGQANFVAVRHIDGSIARYAYYHNEKTLEARPDAQPGYPAPVWTGDPEIDFTDPTKRRIEQATHAVSQLVSSQGWRFDGAAVAPSSSVNPVHVRPGHGIGFTGSPCEPELRDSYGWVLVTGIIFSVLSLGLVFGAGFTIWKGEPPQTVFSNTEGSPFTRLFNASDTNYSYGVKLMYQAKKDTDSLNKMAKLQEKMKACPVPEKFDQKFCECLQLGPIEQYGNSFSDLLFVAYGLIILGTFAGTGPDRQPYVNRMTAGVGYTITYGLVAIFMGPGSMLLHISMTASGGLGDGLSMYMFGGFLLAYNWVRLADLCDVWFYVIFLGVVILFTVVNVAMLYSEALAPLTTLLMVVLILPAAILLIIIVNGSKIKTHEIYYLWWSLAFFVAAFGIWFPSYTDKPLCNPDWPIFSPQSPIQGHALWHMLAATAVFFMYWHFKHQEEELPVCPGFPRLHFTVSEAPPPGPGLEYDAPVVHPGDRLPEIKFKPVKFTDGSVAADEARPWSMRKYASDNEYLGPPPFSEGEAYYYPKDGEHTPPEPIDGPAPPSGSGAASGGSSPSGPPEEPPSAPSMPGGGMPGGGMHGGGTPPDGGMPVP